MNERLWHLWNELRRRRVLHSVGFYLAGAWLILQVFDVALEEVGLPPWTMALSIWLVLAGIPLVILVSWRYDVTTEGIKRTPPPVLTDGMDLSLKPVDYLFISLAATFVIAVTLGLMHMLRSESPGVASEAIDPHSIAVLPFENIGGSDEESYLGLGLAEDILHRLAITDALPVASRTASFELDRKDLSIPEIGRKLGVRYLLEGSVRREEDRLRIVVQLIDSWTGYHSWSGSYDRSMQDLFSIYDEISGAVTGELQLKIAPESEVAAAPTRDIQAYDYFLQARGILRTGARGSVAFQKRRDLVSEGLQSQDPDFEQAESLLMAPTGVLGAADAYNLLTKAIERDPEFAEAWARRCQAQMDWHFHQPDSDRIRLAEADCVRALELKPGLPEGHVALGDIFLKTGWYEGAIEEYKSALDFHADNAEAWLGLGQTYAALHRDGQAEYALNRAIDLDPEYLSSYYALGEFLFNHGRYADAASVYGRLTGHPHADAGAHNGLAISYYMMGEFEQAAAAYRKTLDIAPTASAYSNVGTQYFYNGQFEDAAAMYRQAIAMGSTRPLWWGNLGDALNEMDGGKEAAAEAYRQAASLAQDLLATNPDSAETLANLAHYEARLGNDAQAMRYLERALAAAPDDYYSWYFAALVHLEAGREPEALDAVQRSVELGYSPVILSKDPQFSGLEDSETFLGLISEPARVAGK